VAALPPGRNGRAASWARPGDPLVDATRTSDDCLVGAVHFSIDWFSNSVK
jgi:hypothetical protein